MNSNKHLFFTLLASALLLSACKKEEYFVECPLCDSTMTWESYGRLKLEKATYEGFFVIGDNEVLDLKDNCGWTIRDGKNGGNIHPLELTDCNESVIMNWQYDRFQFVEVFANWQGRTSEDIEMGATLGQFLKVYPDFQLLDDTRPDKTYTYQGSRYSVHAFFDPNTDLLKGLRIERQ